MTILPYLNDEQRERVLLNHPTYTGIEKLNKDLTTCEYEISYLKFWIYWQMKPFAPKLTDMEGKLARAIPAWKEKITRVRMWKKERSLHEQVYWAFDPFSQYIMLLFCSDDVDMIESELTPYLEWLEWTRKNKTRATYLSNPGGHDRVADPRHLLPILQYWMEARRNPERRETLGWEAMKYFDKWFYTESIRTPGTLGFPLEILLSIVMRIDLGLDQETCRNFARYFMPYLTVFPHIRSKLEELNVEYEPPSDLLSLEEVELLRIKYNREMSRDPETGVSIYRSYQKN